MSRRRRNDPEDRRAQELERLLDRGTEDHYLDPVLYDFEYGDETEDIEWYLSQVAQHAPGGPILELGAGTGRIALPLAEAGHEILALDRMSEMLDHLVEKSDALPVAARSNLEPILGDMTELPLEDESVQMVIAPFNALMHLYDWRQLHRCFQEAFRVLEPGGTFAFDVLLPDIEWLTLPPDERHCVTRFEHPQSGEKMVYSTNHTYDHATQVCHIRIYYDRDTGKKFRPPKRPLKLVHLAHRQIFPEEIRALLGLVGFDEPEMTGDFRSHGLDAETEAQCIVAHKPRG